MRQWPPAGVKWYYSDEWVAIAHGDCREILPSLPKVDLVLTDPPYGVGYKYEDSYNDAHGDYAGFILPVFNRLRDIAGLVLITTGMYNLWLYPQADWVLCWAKPGSTRRNGLGGFNEWEPVLVYGKRRIYNDFKLLPDVANHSKDSGVHPCPKPLNLYTWLVSVGADPCATVLDPFLGSGTTAVAAKKLNRHCIGIEIEEKYCEIAANRCRQQVFDFTDTTS